MSSTTRRLPPSRDPLPPAAPPSAIRRRARGAARSIIAACVTRAVRTAPGLALVNYLHRGLTLHQKRRFFYLCFDESCRVEGLWIAGFGGRRVVLPLHRDFELAWIAAIGFHGHDTEIHELYETLVRAPRAPRVFFDVGASYGLHSLKLLAHGVRVVSFEPNTDCHPFFLEACRTNGLRPDIRPVAVGRAAGVTTLVVPAGRTYLGSTAPERIEQWSDTVGLVTSRVPEVTLDDVVRAEGIAPDLVKIDAEGSELAVLEGAHTLLERTRPLVVFESWPASEARAALFDVLTAHAYEVYALGLASPPSPALTPGAFLRSSATNFLARPVPDGL